MKRIALFISFLTLTFPLFASAAFTTVDDFESYTTGNLTGQGGWTGGTKHQVENTVVKNGSQAVSALDNDLVGNTVTSGLLTSMTQGTTTVWLRKTGTATVQFFRLKNGTTIEFQVQMRPSGTVDFLYCASTQSAFATYSGNNWYQVDVHLDATGQKAQAVFNGSYSSIQTCNFTKIDHVEDFEGSDNSGETSYMDYITFCDDGTSPCAVASAAITSILGLVDAHWIY